MDVRAIVDCLAAHADADRAAGQASYLHSELRHLGATVPQVRACVRGAWRACGGAGRAAVLSAASTLWAEPVHEHRLAAVELLIIAVDRLEPHDELVLVESMLRQCRTWALVDPLAAKVAGPLIDRLDAEALAGGGGVDAGAGGGDAVLERWISDEDFWVRRAALLAHLEALRRGQGDFERFGRLADRVLDEREFFIRKAIGWVLRDVGRRRPEAVAAWVGPRRDRLSGVTRREVAKVVDLG
ncbi:MAG: DNA alkylation repair protein [Acidimicrobiales bacterium]